MTPCKYKINWFCVAQNMIIGIVITVWLTIQWPDSKHGEYRKKTQKMHNKKGKKQTIIKR